VAARTLTEGDGDGHLMRRHVAVAELVAHHHVHLRPQRQDGLISGAALVGALGLPLPTLDDGGVQIEGGDLLLRTASIPTPAPLRDSPPPSPARVRFHPGCNSVPPLPRRAAPLRFCFRHERERETSAPSRRWAPCTRASPPTPGARADTFFQGFAINLEQEIAFGRTALRFPFHRECNVAPTR